MQRLFASLLFCAVATFASAQSREINVKDTDAMRTNAAKHAQQVDAAVTLSDDQKPRVNEVYMIVERRLAAMDQRFDVAGMSAEDRAVEMKSQWAGVEQMVDFQLAQILTADQMNKWHEAMK
jgi:hypothetical protein